MLQSIWKTLKREGKNTTTTTTTASGNSNKPEGNKMTKKNSGGGPKHHSKMKDHRHNQDQLDQLDLSSTSTKKTVDTVTDDLALDHFPDFHDITTIKSISIPNKKEKKEGDSEHSSSSSEDLSDDNDTDSDDDDTDEEDVEQQREKYCQSSTVINSKEDQDVQVFLALAERMSLSSLLHILQGHVRSSTNLSNDCLQPYLEIAQAETNRRNNKRRILSTSTSKNNKNEEQDDNDELQEPKRKKLKKFRFAEVTNNQVRVVIHPVESYKEFKDELWWNPYEMSKIRQDLIELVYFFRKHNPSYIQSIETIALSTDKTVVEEQLKRLTQGSTGGSIARGCEAHIVKFLSDHRKQTIQSVLEEQDDCWNSKDDATITTHCLREISISYSKVSTNFALRMAQCDEIEALKATMCKWRSTTLSSKDAQVKNSGFFNPPLTKPTNSTSATAPVSSMKAATTTTKWTTTTTSTTRKTEVDTNSTNTPMVTDSTPTVPVRSACI